MTRSPGIGCTRRRRNHEPTRARDGVRKVCRHGWRQWPKCACAWYFSYKPRGGGPRYRFSLDVELGRHVESKTEAEQIATDIRSAINAGTFRQTAAVAAAPSVEAVAAVLTLDQFAPIYIERAAKASGKRTWANDAGVLARFRESLGVDGRRLGDWSLSAITEDTIEVFFASLAGFAASTHVRAIRRVVRARPQDVPAAIRRAKDREISLAVAVEIAVPCRRGVAHARIEPPDVVAN